MRQKVTVSDIEIDNEQIMYNKYENGTHLPTQIV